jgi:hypothetical protein
MTTTTTTTITTGHAPSRAAIVYDFDGTLARGNIQEHTFLPELGVDKDVFWAEVGRLKREHDADQILVYMWWMLQQARAKGVTVSKEMLRKHGSATPLYDGLDGATSWFDRINAYAAAHGQALEHYIVSSGNREIIEGCSIYGRFTRVFASQFIYDDAGAAVWPGVAINYTTKTQFLFRINKGVTSSWDDAAVNRWQPMNERPVPFTRMIFIGDGDTDIPSMKMVRHQGGYSIAVYDEADWPQQRSKEKLHRLIAEDRAHFVAPANYSDGSQLDVIVRGILGRFAIDAGYRGAGT